MNPRLPIEWLRYLVTIGGREDDDGWRWKLDPMLRFGGFGPWRPEWSMMRLPGLSMPVLGMLGLVPETMGWGTLPEDVERWLPPGATFVAFDDVGHFLHIEQPDRIAEVVLDFLGDPPAAGNAWAPVTEGHEGFGASAHTKPCAVTGQNPDGVVGLAHGRATLAVHELRGGGGRALLLLHGLAERTPSALPAHLASWPGPVYGLDFTGHGRSSLAPGGGFTAEILMADAAIALDHIGAATVFGRGLGAYVALLLAGARPDLVRGAILFDGAGISGGGNGPGSPAITNVDVDAVAPPDPFALAELSRDVRPPDYASTFARMALQFSDLDQPIFVASVNRPDWLDAVASEPGVVTGTLGEALASYGA
jgi:pimeloyl-ACP methyl ester carboxylesterase